MHMKGVKAGFVFIMLLLAYLNVMGQSYHAEARLDTNRIQIGDQVHFSLILNQPETARVEFPQWQERITAELEILRTYPRDTLRGEQQESITIRQRYLLTSFDSGAVEIPPVSFLYRGSQGIDSVLTPPVNLYVETVRVDTTGTIFGIKGPLGAPLSWGEVMPWLLGVLALGLIVWAVIFVLQRRKKKEPLLKPRKPAEPAHVYALRELDRLKEDRLWQNDRLKAYYTRLSNILRTYLWMRYSIKTLERTTEQILGSLGQSDMEDQKAYNLLADNLRFADLVKFARMQPAPEENEASLQQAYDFVNMTKYIPEASQGEQDGEEEPVEQQESTGDNKTDQERR